ncbi:MAG: polysaccharide biosynthesis protein, partial [Bdellovibrionales bacterium]|nr:polysaccharide biosynthesis protein [Bdellovibrionales bacterium]
VLILSVFRPKEEIALYGYPASMIELLLILPIYFMNSTLPTLSRAFKDQREKIQQIFSLAFNFLYTMALPMTIGGIILARPLMALITNDAFLTGNTTAVYGADVAFQILLIPCSIAYLTTLLSFTIIASGNQGKLLKLNAIGVLFNIITNLILIPSYGFPAAALTTLLSELLLFSITLWECRKYAPLHFDWPTLTKVSLGGAIMGTFVFLSQNNIPTIPLIGIGGLIYIASLVPLGVINKEMLAHIKK